MRWWLFKLRLIKRAVSILREKGEHGVMISSYKKDNLIINYIPTKRGLTIWFDKRMVVDIYENHWHCFYPQEAWTSYFNEVYDDLGA